MLQIALDAAGPTAPRRRPRPWPVRVAAMLAVVVAVLAVARSPWPHRLVAASRPVATALPDIWGGRSRIALVGAELGGAESRVTLAPSDLDLAFVTSCPVASDAVRIDVTVNGRRFGAVRDCGPRSLAPFGRSSLEDFWASYGVRRGRPLVVGVRASLRDVPPGLRAAVPAAAYLGVYQAPASRLPAHPGPVPGAGRLPLLARAVLDADHARVPLIVPLPPGRRASFAGSCGGGADSLEYEVVAGRILVGRGRCTDPPGVARLDLAALPAGELAAGMLTVDLVLRRPSGEHLVDHPPAADARAIVALYTG